MYYILRFFNVLFYIEFSFILIFSSFFIFKHKVSNYIISCDPEEALITYHIFIIVLNLVLFLVHYSVMWKKEDCCEKSRVYLFFNINMKSFREDYNKWPKVQCVTL